MESGRIQLACRYLCEVPATRTSAGNIGILIFTSLALGIIYFRLVNKNRNEVKLLLILIILPVLLSLKMTFNILGVNILNPSAIFLPLFPGALYLDRFGVLAGALAVLLWVIVVSHFISIITYKKTTVAVVGIILWINMLDISPYGTREIATEYKSYEPINVALLEDRGMAVIFSPYTFHGRRWLQQAYIGLPMQNSVFSVSVGSLPSTTTKNDSKRIACQLEELGITHLISEEGPNVSALNTFDPITNSRFFVFRSSTTVPAYEFGAKTTLSLYKIECR